MSGNFLDRALTSKQKGSYTAVLFYASRCPFSQIVYSKYEVLSSIFPQIEHFAIEESSAMPRYDFCYLFYLYYHIRRGWTIHLGLMWIPWIRVQSSPFELFGVLLKMVFCLFIERGLEWPHINTKKNNKIKKCYTTPRGPPFVIHQEIEL